MTTRLDPKFTTLLSDTATKLESLELLPRVRADAAPILTDAAADLASQLRAFAEKLAEAQQAKLAADLAEKEAAILAREQAAAEKSAAGAGARRSGLCRAWHGCEETVDVARRPLAPHEAQNGDDAAAGCIRGEAGLSANFRNQLVHKLNSSNDHDRCRPGDRRRQAAPPSAAADEKSDCSNFVLYNDSIMAYLFA